MAAAAAAANQYLNTYMNNIDPGKDFKIGWESGGVKRALSNPIHGAFIKDRVIATLFNQGGLLTANDNAVVVGVGDKKGELKAKIDAAIRLNDLEKQQIVRLKFSATGVDERLSGFNLAHDAGPGPDKLFKDYTLVLTPGSILDAASRDKTHRPQMDGLATPSTINQAILAQIGMQDALESIEYGGQTGGKYSFVFNTKIPGFTRIEVEFNSQNYSQTALRNATAGGPPFPAGLDLFAGNPTKNEFVHDRWNGGAPTQMNLAIILLITLMKELGDTLQVIWLKALLGPLGASADTTAICTHDTVVWLRAIINEVSCVFTEGNTSTFYPVAASEAQKLAAKAIIKQKLVDELVNNNSEVVRSISSFIVKLGDPYTTFYDMPLDAVARGDLTMILRCLEAYILGVSRDIKTRARLLPAGDSDAIRNFVVSHKMKSPFHVIDRKTDVRHYTSFKTLLPLVIGENKIVFRPEQIYSALRAGRRIDIAFVLGDVPCPAALGPAAPPFIFARGGGKKKKSMKGGAPPLSDIGEFDACIDNNITSPGFISYFIINFIPEFMFIGYAYAKAMQYDNFEKFDVLFKYDTGIFVNSHFGDLLSNNTFDTYPVVDRDQIDACENLMIELSCIVIASYINFQNNPPSLAMYDVIDTHTSWIIIAAGKYLSQSPVYIQLIQALLGQLNNPENNAADIHWNAVEIYKDLYDVELDLCILNMRDTIIPQTQPLVIEPAAARKANRRTTNRSKPRNKKNSVVWQQKHTPNNSTRRIAREKTLNRRRTVGRLSGLSGFGVPRTPVRSSFVP